MTMAVPVSWHDGKMPPAAMFAFLSSSSATNLSFGEASASSRMARSCARWPGRSRCEMSRIAWRVSSVRASGSTRRKVFPAASKVETWSAVSFR